MLHVILVNPEGEENVGAVARAMMNMDVSDLILVDPACDHLSRNALNYAVHAGDLLKKARVVKSLSAALEDADISAAVTRRVGQWRKRDFYLDRFAKHLRSFKNKKVCLVFGREKHGLTNEEIDLCDVVVSIPSSTEFPSLNLAQAVMVTLYEIFKNARDDKGEGKHAAIYEPADRKDFDSMMKQMIQTMDGLGFFKNVPKNRLNNYLRKVFTRAALDTYDANVIRNIFTRIEGIVKRIRKD